MGKLRTTISLAVVFVVAFAGTAVANHIYNDVPTSSEFHDEIAEIGDAGCADGFPGALFKPNDPVKRQQMARFLSRCGGRVAFDEDEANLMGSSGQFFTITDVPFTATADGFVQVTATGSAWTSQENLCPCQIRWRLTDGTAPANADVQGQIDNAPTDDNASYEPMAINAVFPISRGDTVTYTLQGRWDDADTTAMNFAAFMTVAFFPFSGTINN
jgi:hypothetical protein